MNIILLILGFVFLVKGADFFVSGCSNVSKAFGVSSLVIGLTVVAFGTSMPELIVSLMSSINGNSEIAISNVIGSNICNLLLILGSCSMFGEVVISKKVRKRDYPFSMFVYFVMFVLSLSLVLGNGYYGIISRVDGLLLLCFFGLYMFYLFKGKEEGKKEEKEEREQFKRIYLFQIVVGLGLIIMGGDMVVDEASALAARLGVSDTLIGLTIVAVGTSLPEMITSIVATIKKERDIAIGNVVGSNIFNILFILGVSTVVRPIMFNIDVLMDVVVMFVSGLLVYLVFYRDNTINRSGGFILLFTYVLYLCYIVVR